MANLPQPDAQTIPQAVLSIKDGHQDLANEAGRIQNVPAFNQVGQIIQTMQRLSNDIRRLRNRVRRLRGAQQRFEELWVFPILVWFRHRTQVIQHEAILGGADKDTNETAAMV